MRAFSCLCVNVGGKPKVESPDMFAHGMSQFGDGEELEMTISEPGRSRTRKQEKFFHGPVLKAFMELGWGKQEAKDMLALRFIPQEIRLPDDTYVRVPGHTSALKVKDYSEFIEECIQLAAEMGVVVKDAEQWRAEQRRQSRAV